MSDERPDPQHSGGGITASPSAAERIADLRYEVECLRKALRYVIDRVDREFRDQDQPDELDFVLLAVNEVRDLAAPPTTGKGPE